MRLVPRFLAAGEVRCCLIASEAVQAQAVTNGRRFWKIDEPRAAWHSPIRSYASLSGRHMYPVLLLLGPMVRMIMLVLVQPILVFAPTVSPGQSVARAAQLLTNVSVPMRTRFVVNASNATVPRFQLPPQCVDAVATMPLDCPVGDASYCDEFHSLDKDCSQSLALQELWHCFTLAGYVQWEELQQYADGSDLREYHETKWRSLHRRFDEDGDGNISLVDWLSMRGQYAHTMTSCGAALADLRYSWRTAMPIKPCASCAEHWLACNRNFGGGWTLVYQSAGLVNMRSTLEQEPSLLYTHGWQQATRVDGALVDVPIGDDWRSYAQAGGKLADESIRHLCSGQFMVVQPGRQPIFCAFANSSNYADNQPTIKHCLRQYHARALYSVFGWTAESSAHGLSPGSGVNGGVLLALGYSDSERRGASAPWPHRISDAYAPVNDCVCMDAWEYGGYSYSDGGCHSPDGDTQAWCLTLGGCGSAATMKGLSGGTFAYCTNRCRGSEGCPVQVWCRDNKTIPVQYIAPQYTSQTTNVGSAFEFFIALSGVSVICVIGGAVYVFSKIRLQWLDRLKLPPRSALVIESFQADKSNTRELTTLCITCKTTSIYKLASEVCRIVSVLQAFRCLCQRAIWYMIVLTRGLLSPCVSMSSQTACGGGGAKRFM